VARLWICVLVPDLDFDLSAFQRSPSFTMSGVKRTIDGAVIGSISPAPVKGVDMTRVRGLNLVRVREHQ
jgi:hypothetical protein